MTLWLQNQAGQKRKINKSLQILKKLFNGVKEWPFCKDTVHVLKEHDDRHGGLPVRGMPGSLISGLLQALLYSPASVVFLLYVSCKCHIRYGG